MRTFEPTVTDFDELELPPLEGGRAAAGVAASDGAGTVCDERVDIDAIATRLSGCAVERIAAHLIEQVDEVLIRFDFGMRIEELIEGGLRRCRRRVCRRRNLGGLGSALNGEIAHVNPADDVA